MNVKVHSLIVVTNVRGIIIEKGHKNSKTGHGADDKV